MIYKQLLLIPSDIAKLTKDNTLAGELDKDRIIASGAIAEINISIPIVSDNIVKPVTHLSTTFEQKELIEKTEMSSSAKNILIDVDLEELLEECLVGTELLAYIKENTKLIYIASTKSLLTNSIVDIYYHSVDKCLYVAPELSPLGNPPAIVSSMNISLYRVAPLKLETSLNSSTMFSIDTGYYNSLEFKDTATNLDSGLVTAKTDVTVYTLLVQGLNSNAVNSEYSRNTATGGTSNNLNKDRPIHLIVLEEPATNLLKNNILNSCLIAQATPYDWRLRVSGKSAINKIAFPIHI